MKIAVLLISLPPLPFSPQSICLFFPPACPIHPRYPGIFWEFIQEPGEVVFIPAGWGHGILNIEPTIGISMQMGTPYGSMPPVVQAFMEKMD